MGDNAQVVKQLNAARDIVLRDPGIYPQVVPGVLPVIGSSQSLEQRRWGADFLAETFASPVLNAEEKQKLSLPVLDTLKAYLSRKEEKGEEEDASVVKAAVQCAASLYPLVFRHTIGNSQDAAEVWAKMAGIKSSILRRMDTAPAGVRICCIKFVACVVLVQTPGVILDPRRQDQNEISLALVPRDHAVIPPSNLEAEASGLLDRLLSVLQENTADALVATATLNSLSTLVQRRANSSSKILSVVLNFNPLRLSGANVGGKEKVAVKSMTRTTMSFLMNVLKRNPGHTLGGRIQQQVERLRHGLMEVFSDQQNAAGKRAAPDEPIDGLSDGKRLKLDAEAEAGTTPLQRPFQYPPLPKGYVSYAQLFTLSNDPRAAGFHVEAIPQQIVAQLVPPLLGSIDQGRLDEALNVVRGRFLELQRRPPPGTAEEEDDDYDPDTGFEDPGQIANRMDQQGQVPAQQEDLAAVATFELPAPPPLTEEEQMEYQEIARERLFGALGMFDENIRKAKADGKKTTSSAADGGKGFNQLAISISGNGLENERDGWITLLSRLATRSSFPLDGDDSKVKQEHDDRAIVKKSTQGNDLPTKIRQAFHKYIMDDWRRRIDVAIAWLNEEWYADKVLAKHRKQANGTATTSSSEEQEEIELPTYTPLALSLLDSLIPYLDTKDGRYLIRFLSEIPSLPAGTFERIEKIAQDPERVQLATQTLLYLIMLRPPVRRQAVECAGRIWRGNSMARGSVGKVLGKWGPELMVEEGKVTKEEEEEEEEERR